MSTTSAESWAYVKAWADRTLEDDRMELERPGTPPERSAHLRGRIEFARDLLALPAQAVPLPMNEDDTTTYL